MPIFFFLQLPTVNNDLLSDLDFDVRLFPIVQDFPNLLLAPLETKFNLYSP